MDSAGFEAWWTWLQTVIVVPPDRARLIKALTYSAYRAALKESLYLPVQPTKRHAHAPH